jgi:hypothetical protein
MLSLQDSLPLYSGFGCWLRCVGWQMHGARWRRAAAEQGEFSMARAPRGWWWWWWPASSFSRWRRGNGRPGRYP